MAIIQNISGMLTDYARQLDARGLAEGVLVGDWAFQVGSGGFDPTDPLVVTEVDPTAQALETPRGGMRPLGREVSSGASAAITPSELNPGFVTVTGLADMPMTAVRRWLHLSTGPAAGSWVISRWLSEDSVEIYAPLVSVAHAGPVAWSFREACVLRPNPRAIDFHGRLLAPDASVDGFELGEVGIFGRVIRAPALEDLVGTTVLWAVAHHSPVIKHAQLVLAHHVCVQG